MALPSLWETITRCVVSVVLVVSVVFYSLITNLWKATISLLGGTEEEPYRKTARCFVGSVTEERAENKSFFSFAYALGIKQYNVAYVLGKIYLLAYALGKFCLFLPMF